MQWIVDSSPTYRGFSQTSGTIKVICHDGLGNNSLANNIQALLYEGDDDYDHITTYGKRTIEELEDLAQNGMSIDIEKDDGTTETHHVAITIVEGGDLKWLNATCGLSGCSAEFSCPWCLVTSGEYAKCKFAKMRDTVFMLMMAHAVIPGVLEAGYTCPGCNKVSNEQRAVSTKKQHCILSSPNNVSRKLIMMTSSFLQTVEFHGQHPPTSKQAKKDYPRNHFGHKHKRTSTMSRLSWRKRIPDMLHILLRVIAHLYWHTCQKHCTSAEIIELLHAFMKQKLGVTVNSRKRLTKNQDQANIGKRKESFIGAECLLLLEQYPSLLDFMYDVQLKGKRPEEKEKARKALATFDVLWKLTTGCRLKGDILVRSCLLLHRRRYDES